MKKPMKPQPNVLLVEGMSDRRLIPHLMEKNGIPWPRGNEPVWIDVPKAQSEGRLLGEGGVDVLLGRDYLRTYLVAPGLKALGVIVDADDKLPSRWQAIRREASSAFDEVPMELPEDGLIIENAEGLRFGAWIMPDNRSGGMIETLLPQLLTEQRRPLYDHAKAVCIETRLNHGAPFKEAHLEKAAVHTFLAWQDEPGPQVHEAVMYEKFGTNSPAAVPFVDWFKRLYNLAG